MTLTGRVVEEQKNYFVVATPSGMAESTTSGTLRQQRKKVCTGDIVDLKVIDTDPLRAVITAIHTRSSFIRRPTLANCTHLLCVCTVKEPPLNLEMFDHLLFTAEVFGLSPCIIINKIDQHGSAEARTAAEISAVCTEIGYPVFSVSSTTGEGIERVMEFCAGKISACAGLSGVGKSTMLAAIFPEKNFRIGELSATANRGTHTTTSTTLLPLSGGGFIADTPGLALIDLPAVAEEEVILHFPELARCIGMCRFNNCMHDREPGCSVTQKVRDGAIAPWRHEHYLKIITEMRRKRRQYR